MSDSQKTIDTFTPPKRYWKGQKKTDKSIAPWSGSTFETDYEQQQKLSEYTGVFHAIEKDCREKPLIPLSETKDWMVGNPSADMDLTTTNATSYQSHPRHATAKTRPRRDHTSTFLDTEQTMKGCSTYMRSYVEKPEATRPPACRPGPPENFIATEKDMQCPTSVSCQTYRKYAEAEQRSAKRKPIVLSPEYGNVPTSVTDTEDFSTSYADAFQGHKEYKRAIPLRPEENGIHYDLNSKCDLSTTHDRTFKSNRFPGHRTVQRTEPVGGPYQPVSTMMSDFKVKTIRDPAKPFLPPVALRETFGDQKSGYVTGYNQAFNAPDLKTVTPVKNCKPVHQYSLPTEKMEGSSTAHKHFTGKSCPPAVSCKPKVRSVQTKEDMNFKTEYNERFLQGS